MPVSVQDGGVGEEAGGAGGGEGAAAAGEAAAEAGGAAAHLHRPRVRAAVPRDGRAPGGVPAHRYGSLATSPQSPRRAEGRSSLTPAGKLKKQLVSFG